MSDTNLKPEVKKKLTPADFGRGKVNPFKGGVGGMKGFGVGQIRRDFTGMRRGSR